MDRLGSDIDFINALVSISILKDVAVACLCGWNVSLLNRNPGERAGVSCRVGLDDMLQLTFSPYWLQLERGKQQALADALLAKGVVVKVCERVYGNSGVSGFGETNCTVDGAVLYEALESVGVQTLRLVQFNMKLSLSTFNRLILPHIASEAAHVFDVSTNFQLEQEGYIPLAFDQGPNENFNKPAKVFNMCYDAACLQLDKAVGFLQAKSDKTINNNTKIGSVVVYPGGLVHLGKGYGIDRRTPEIRATNTARGYRKKLIEVAETILDEINDEREHLADLLGTLRIEIRIRVDGGKREIRDAISVLRKPTLALVREWIGVNLKIYLLSIETYCRHLRKMIDRVNDRYIGIAWGKSAGPPHNPDITRARLVDFKNAIGIHVSAAAATMVCKQITWKDIPEPLQYRHVSKSHYIWEADEGDDIHIDLGEDDDDEEDGDNNDGGQQVDNNGEEQRRALQRIDKDNNIRLMHNLLYIGRKGRSKCAASMRRGGHIACGAPTPELLFEKVWQKFGARWRWLLIVK